MKTVVLKTWEDFEIAVSTTFSEVETLRDTTQPVTVSTPLFRGQSDAGWKLETTLDRAFQEEISVEQYLDIILSVRPAVISLTNRQWDIPEMAETDKYYLPPPGYEFMIYLRHHGFPSPLLDWSRSPYVAAYFAFRSSEKMDHDNAAIYSYLEYAGKGKVWSPSEANIFGSGPYVISHKRHYAQQCEYTRCIRRDGGRGLYARHHDAVARNEEGQDLLTKYEIPRTERSKVLTRLERMNITAFSLFGNEESLMETLAYQEIEKRFLHR
jgi:hypothetical protein